MKDQRLWDDPVNQRIWITAAALFTLIMLLVCCGLLSRIYGIGRSNRQDQPEQPGSVIGYLRGGRIVIVRLPGATPRVEQIAVFDSALATRGFFPSQPNDTYSRLTLPQEQWKAIDELRTEWCEDPPKSPAPPATPYYDIGLQCSPFITKRVIVTPENLPAVLATLIDTVPSPQQ